MLITVDFETRSAADLRRVGSYLYSLHASTSILCLAWSYDGSDEVHLWHPEFPSRALVPATPPRKPKASVLLPGLLEEGRDALEELFARVRAGALVEAHNVFFERCVWTNIGSARLGWPAVDPKQWRCSAAKAASYALPRNLADAAAGLKLAERKDTEGGRLMLKLSQPASPTKADSKREWHDDRDELRRLFEYCKQDVRTEKALSAALRDLSPKELSVWQLDQEINWRGIYCDRDMVEAALEHAAREEERAKRELQQITGGLVAGHTKRRDLLEWLEMEDYALPDTRGVTIDAATELGDASETVGEALELVRRMNRTSTKKYRAMQQRVGLDGRIRDILRYHGAATGRWSGVGIQPQNFVRKMPADIDGACSDITWLSTEQLREKHGDVMGLLSGSLRGALCAPPGSELVVADYASIEARGTFWLAGDEVALAVLRDGWDIYRDMAARIYKKSAEDVSSPERQMGKLAILGLGYQMGPAKFQATAATNGIQLPLDEEILAQRLGRAEVSKIQKECGFEALKILRARKLELAPKTLTANDVVEAYRTEYPRVCRLWWDMEAAAIEAVNRGPSAAPVDLGRVRWGWRGRFLHCRLPSGRLLSYSDPWIKPYETPWGELRPKLHFMGLDPHTHQWSPQTTYGGKLVENVVQALSRDLMAEAMLRVEAAGYPVVLSVHDEVVCEVPEHRGDLDGFLALIAEVPPWASGLPLKAEGWRGRRYRK